MSTNLNTLNLYNTLVRPAASDKIVLGSQVEGGYFVCETLPSWGTAGQLCYCTGDSKFHQYDGENWVEAKLGGGTESTEGLTYKVSADETYAICTGLDPEICTDTDIVIASTYQDKPVMSIDTMAFNGCSSLESIEIPESVTSIGEGAFNYCTNLKHLEIPSGVETISPMTFYGCGSLTSITIPDSVESIEYGAFQMCSSLTAIEIPCSVLSMKASVFEGCSNLTIYCESSSKPTEWVEEWNIDGCTVVWGYALNVSSLNHKIAQTNKKISLVEQLLNIKILANKPIPMQSVTYSRLVQLRDQAKLVSGMFYRITDYQCTTAQIDTRAMNNRFDIIVQALSANTLSEAACADYHREYSWNGPATIRSEFIADSASSRLIEGSIIPYYYEYIDFQGGGPALGVYKTDDIFIGYNYVQNDQAQEVPAIYKTDRSGLDPTSANYNAEYAGPDFGDKFVYVGRAEIAGETYDKWQKIDDEDTFTWESDAKCYLYTNVITNASNLSVIEGIQPEEANIPAWELKYCLDNDTSRFAWACEQPCITNLSTSFSDGEPLVRQPSFDGWLETHADDHHEYIYAWGTQAGVDDGDGVNFVYSLTETLSSGDTVWDISQGELVEAEVSAIGKGVIYYMKDEHNNECPYDFKNIQFQRSVEWQEEHSDFITSLGLAVDDLEWFYTFSYINIENNTAEDLTLKQDLPSDEEGVKYGTHDNSMLPYIQDAINVPRIALNNNVMIYCPAADLCFYGCYGNSFKNNCFSNTFGNYCYSNTFGDNCYSNTFGNYYHSSTFGNYCTSNTFGNYCYSSTFGNYCDSNTFGNDCTSNTFGNCCNANTFGNCCDSNTFGNYCDSNTFGNDCYSNTFGDCCISNTFGSSADSLIAYAKYIRFADDCSYVKLLNSESEAADVNYVQNITISAGVSGTSHSPLELQVSRNAAPVVYEAAGTTHIILD